jgi:hypothetical protein
MLAPAWEGPVGKLAQIEPSEKYDYFAEAALTGVRHQG